MMVAASTHGSEDDPHGEAAGFDRTTPSSHGGLSVAKPSLLS
jgi:hypothetical protein